MKSEQWRQKAENMCFVDGKSIVQISALLGVSTVSLSKYLNSLPQYAAEKNRRKEENKAKRKEYSRNHKRETRKKSPFDYICGLSLKREHETAVKILSKERFFNE